MPKPAPCWAGRAKLSQQPAQQGAGFGMSLEAGADGERILLVASSDMAHYPPARVCEEVDEDLLGPLLRLDAEDLRARESRWSAANRPGLVCGLCGIDPVR